MRKGSDSGSATRVRTIAAGLLLTLSLASCTAGGHTPLAQEPPDAEPPELPDGAVTWEAWVSPFSIYYCVPCHSPTAPCGGAGCHSPSDPAVEALQFDMHDKSSWTARAATIHCGIVVTQDPAWNCNVPPENYPKMAPGLPLPTDEARGVVADWLEAGCP